MVKSDQIQAAAALPPETPVRIRGWMSPRNGLEILEKGKISCSYRDFEGLFVGYPARGYFAS